MIKSLEVVIALLLLFLFIAVIYEGNFENTSNRDLKTADFLTSNSRNPAFRELISNEDVDNLSNTFSDYIDINYSIKLCNWLDNNCEESIQVPSGVSTTAQDYYFYDSNKTLSITTWVK